MHDHRLWSCISMRVFSDLHITRLKKMCFICIMSNGCMAISLSETNGIWVPFKRPFHKLCINNDLWSGNFMGLTHAIKLLQLSNNLIASLAFFILLSWFRGMYILAFISPNVSGCDKLKNYFFKQPHSMQCPTGSITAKAWGNGFSL